MSEPLLEVCELTLREGGRTLVRELSFQIRAGELWCLLGPNGAGKTTFLRTVVGLRGLRAGKVWLGARPLGDWPALQAARMRAFLPQNRHDAFSASVLDTVVLGRHPHLRRREWEGDGEWELAGSALAAMELAGFEERDVLTLSGGERQRVAIAAVLVQDAQLLLLDEPLSHLDLHHRVLVLEHLRKLCKQRDKGVLLTVHDLNLAARFASHALVFSGRGATRHGPAAQVMRETELTEVFGHRVARIDVEGRTLFVAE